jgi:hypothetical protein
MGLANRIADFPSFPRQFSIGLTLALARTVTVARKVKMTVTIREIFFILWRRSISEALQGMDTMSRS